MKSFSSKIKIYFLLLLINFCSTITFYNELPFYQFNENQWKLLTRFGINDKKAFIKMRVKIRTDIPPYREDLPSSVTLFISIFEDEDWERV